MRKGSTSPLRPTVRRRQQRRTVPELGAAVPGNAPDTLLAAVVRGDVPDVAAIVSMGADVLCEAARDHDVLAVVADRLANADAVPPDMRLRFHDELHKAVAADLAIESELRRLLNSFAASAIDAIV